MQSETHELSSYEMEKFLFHRGESHKSYEFFGAHLLEDGRVSFSVWAPNAKMVNLVGDFNNWDGHQHKMFRINEGGIYNLIVEGLKEGDNYKYEITPTKGHSFLKSDPYAFFSEVRPHTASVVFDLNQYQWQDRKWMTSRKRSNIHKKPINIYELHLGSWMKKPDGWFNDYSTIADLLIPYISEKGYTHIEIMPLSEHPFDGSWGYQTTGYYSATSRFGDPNMLMNLIDRCHQNGIGIIMDWVPCHYCRDDHGLSHFDGGHVFESAYDFVATNHQWGTNNFDFSRREVWSFLISNAMFWFDKYHIDGIRVDAVAFMLYMNYGKEDNLLKNKHGGEENLDAIEFIKTLNKVVFEQFPGVMMIAEESTAWPLVTSPIHDGGLGFNFKWNMGWMNDTLKYFAMDYDERSINHNLLTFSLTYAFSENYILPFSHDEVVHGKRSLIGRMPGDYWQQFANNRLLLCHLMTHPGKKLTFMGTELGHFIEWDYKKELDWFLLQYESHAAFQYFTQSLNQFYKANTALYEIDDSFDGFKWIDCDNYQQSLLIFERRGRRRADDLLIVLNFGPLPHEALKVGIDKKAIYQEVFNSDHRDFGGSHHINDSPLQSEALPWHGKKHAITVKVPPLGCIMLKKTLLSASESNKNEVAI